MNDANQHRLQTEPDEMAGMFLRRDPLSLRMAFVFVINLSRGIIYLNSVFVLMLATLSGLSILFAFVEKLSLGDSFYCVFITALTIGYGDISPETFSGRIIAIAVGIIGLLCTGIFTAVAVRALQSTLSGNPMHMRPLPPK